MRSRSNRRWETGVAFGTCPEWPEFEAVDGKEAREAAFSEGTLELIVFKTEAVDCEDVEIAAFSAPVSEGCAAYCNVLTPVKEYRDAADPPRQRRGIPPTLPNLSKSLPGSTAALTTLLPQVKATTDSPWTGSPRPA